MSLSKGELAMSSEMEKLQSALFFDNVPDTWTKLAYPSTYSLAVWCVSVVFIMWITRVQLLGMQLLSSSVLGIMM